MAVTACGQEWRGVGDNVDGSLDDWFVKLEKVRPALIETTNRVLTELGV